MSKRSSFQERFANTVHARTKAQFLNEITPVGELNSDEVLNVYTNDYYSRLTEALGEHFEAIWAVLGDEEFYQVCQEYIEQNPSTSDDLGQYGKSFPQFLKCHPCTKEFSFLSDLAKFENDFWKTFHLPVDGAAVSLKDQNSEALFSTKFTLRESVRFHHWKHRLYDLWNQRKEGISELGPHFFSPQFIILYKDGYQVKVSESSKLNFEILQEFQNGNTFETLFRNIEISTEDVISLFEFLGRSSLLKAA